MDHEKYAAVMREIDETFAEIVQEFTDSRNTLRNDGRFVRTRLLLAFSFLEILCGIYNSYFGLNLTNRALLEKWLNEYCLVNENGTFNTHPYIRLLTASHLYSFRNSIIHAFGLPEEENGISIISPNGTETADVVQKISEELEKIGHKVCFVSADSLLQLFIDGFRLMHPIIFKDSSIATLSDLAGLERLLKELGRRGAKGIPLDSRLHKEA